MEKLHESLKEFTSDGAKYQSATPSEKTWKSIWSSHLKIGQSPIVSIEAGLTSTMEDVHTAVVNVTVKPLKLENGAEDQAIENISVYYRDFKTEAEAEKALREIQKSAIHVNEEGNSPLSTQLHTQIAAPTIGLGI
jgi:hypothetical protein